MKKATNIKDKKNIIIIVAALILVVVAVCVTVFLINNQREPEPVTQTTTKRVVEPYVLLSDIKHDFRDRETIGRIESEDLGISCNLIFGTSDDALRLGAGFHKTSSLPGYSTPPIIGGHVQTVFKGFQNAEVGKIIKIVMPYGEYVYKIKEIKVMDKDEFSFDIMKVPCKQAIFYTCYPFGKVNYVKTQRMFLYCDYVKGPKLLDDIHYTIPDEMTTK